MEQYQNILVPVDFSDNSKKIVKAALVMAEKFKATTHFVFVVQSFEDYSGFFVPHMPVVQFEEEMRQNAETKMRAYLEEVLPAGTAHTSVVLSGDVAEQILSYAETEGIDLIAMGTHGYRGVEKLLFGSVAEKVVKMAPCPVLIINPYKQKE